ncbi:3-dehydroquinate synthase [Agarilytica rhodophyticola]|uniref:3-dehydroquinate synthase n=1 Tax=Agarilytica rhodophyticola TaxID=1737490 RepID=UPI001FEA5A6A|nr:3-dehydroquinate synthase [Agarilytica rhodophyticola]
MVESVESLKSVTLNQKVQVNYDYPVVFTESVFDIENKTLANILSCGQRKSVKVLVVIDAGVHAAYQNNDRPSNSSSQNTSNQNASSQNISSQNVSSQNIVQQIKTYAFANQIDLIKTPLIVSGGEQVKTDDSVLEDIYRLVADEKIDRHSYILAIGGGATLDAVGYAAATAHRGIRLIRMPTTVLAQNDAGVGVKNGVNYLDRKNFLGTFAPPHAVINDYELLATLSDRDKRAGIAEAIKVALIKDQTFFEELYNTRHALAKFEPEAMQHMIFRCAQLHLNHISTSGDPFEMGSARPLDFGHWSAHKLEALSDYRIRHGEAVAVGIALDTLYSHGKSLLGKSDKDRVLELLVDLGFTLNYPELDQLDIKASLEEFREHLGGFLSITLLTAIGSSFEANDIDIMLMNNCLAAIKNNSIENISSTVFSNEKFTHFTR